MPAWSDPAGSAFAGEMCVPGGLGTRTVSHPKGVSQISSLASGKGSGACAYPKHIDLASSTTAHSGRGLCRRPTVLPLPSLSFATSNASADISGVARHLPAGTGQLGNPGRDVLSVPVGDGSVARLMGEADLAAVRVISDVAVDPSTALGRTPIRVNAVAARTDQTRWRAGLRPGPPGPPPTRGFGETWRSVWSSLIP
jgi:hypothetical protein